MQFDPHDSYGADDGAHFTSGAINMSDWSSMELSVKTSFYTENGYDGFNLYYSTDNSTWSFL